MARRGSKIRRNNRGKRVPNINARPRLLPRSIKVSLSSLSDHRIPSFRGLAPNPINVFGSPARVIPRVNKTSVSRFAHVVDTIVDGVVCARRKIRKEVIFASGRGGSRGRKGRYHRSLHSNIHCR